MAHANLNGRVGKDSSLSALRRGCNKKKKTFGETRKYIKNHQNSSQKAPWDGLGDPWRTPSAPGPLPESVLKRFWLPFGVPVGTLLAPIPGSFFVYFSGTLLERLRGVLGGIWEFF